MEITAHLRNLRMSPRKVRRVVNLVRHLPVARAAAELSVRPEEAAEPLRKLFASALANARTMTEARPEEMEIVSFRVDEGRVLKRYRPRSRGMALPIARRSSHISLVLKTPDRPKAKPANAAITPPKEETPGAVPKGEREEKEKGTTPQRSAGERSDARLRPRVPRFGRRFFQRKSV